MRILFLYPRMQISINVGNLTPTSVLSLASFVKEKGHDVFIFERNIDDRLLSQVMAEFSPDVVVCSLIFTHQIIDMQSVCRQVRSSYPKMKILCGGVTASVFPEMFLKEGLVDYIGVSEGEYTLLELLDVVRGLREPSSVQSLVYIDEDGKTVHTPLRPFAALSNFPDIDFSLLPMEKYYSYFPEAPHSISVSASKGCPSECTFCFNASYHRCQYRMRSRAAVMREIEVLVTKYKADGIIFVDELFGANKEELHAYCEDIARLSQKLNRPIPWACSTRVGMLNQDELQHMAASGCWMLNIGVESGSPEILKRIKKGYPLKKLEENFQNCKKVGIKTLPTVIWGFPDETPAQIKQTIHTIFRLDPAFYGAALFFASPGSAEYNKLVAEGRTSLPKSLKEFSEIIDRNFMQVNYSKIPDKELLVIHYFFYWRLLLQNRKEQNMGFLYFMSIMFRRFGDSLMRKGFFRLVYYYFKLFLNAAWYYVAYPGIRKKYDLYPKNFGRTDWDDLEHLNQALPD